MVTGMASESVAGMKSESVTAFTGISKNDFRKHGRPFDRTPQLGWRFRDCMPVSANRLSNG